MTIMDTGIRPVIRAHAIRPEDAGNDGGRSKRQHSRNRRSRKRDTDISFQHACPKKRRKHLWNHRPPVLTPSASHLRGSLLRARRQWASIEKY